MPSSRMPSGECRARGKPGTAIQFQRRELVAVPVLRPIGQSRDRKTPDPPIWSVRGHMSPSRKLKEIALRRTLCQEDAGTDSVTGE